MVEWEVMERARHLGSHWPTKTRSGLLLVSKYPELPEECPLNQASRRSANKSHFWEYEPGQTPILQFRGWPHKSVRAAKPGQIQAVSQ